MVILARGWGLRWPRLVDVGLSIPIADSDFGVWVFGLRCLISGVYDEVLVGELYW